MVGNLGRQGSRTHANTTAKERIPHMRKRLLSFVLAVLMIASLLPAAALAADVVASGTCGAEGDGSNLTWTLDSDGLLTIRGTGAMENYFSDDAPWTAQDVKTVVIDNGVTSIGGFAFDGCHNLTNVTISDSVTEIREYAFSGCTALTGITIPSGVTSMNCAFENCTALTTVTLPDSVEEVIGTFAGCTALTNIKLPRNVSFIEGAFAGCTSLTDIAVAEENPYYCSMSGIVYSKDRKTMIAYPAGRPDTAFAIPEGVTSIGSSAFYECTNLTQVSIPEGITSIGDDAFSGCTNLTQVSIPEGVTKIEYQTFHGCESLESVTIPDAITDIGGNAFLDCDSLKDVYFLGTKDAWQKVSIESGNEAITENATMHYFGEWTREKEPTCTEPGSETRTCLEAGCDKTFTREIPALGHAWDIRNVIKPATPEEDGTVTYTCTRCGEKRTETLKIVGSGTCGAVGEGSSLTWMLDSEGTLTISGTGDMNRNEYDASNPAPWADQEVKKAVIANGITSIGNYAFYGCTHLESVTIPDSVTSIGYGAFENCTSLTSVTIPDGVTSIEGYTFHNCTSLKSASIPDSVTSIDKCAFYDCAHLESVTIPDGVTSIEGGTFRGCTSLESVTIPDGVTSIGYEAFQDCYCLASVAIPNSVTSIDYSTFGYCTSLTSVTIPDGVTRIEDDAFRGCTSLESVTIPSNVKDIYSGAFLGCDALKEVNYLDSKEAFNKISIAEYSKAILQAATIHYFAQWDMEKQPTCTEPGHGTSQCSEDGCTKTYSREFPALGHTWGIRNVIKPATPEEDGTVTYTCTRCGEKRTETLKIVSSGTCGAEGDGSNLTWTLDSEGTLTISGTGDMVRDGNQLWRDQKVKKAVIANGVTSISAYAFSGCTYLESITIPNSVTSIGTGAFRGCSSLTNVTIPNGVTSIDYEIFGNCTSLTSVSIPDSVTSIGQYAFYQCVSLESVTIPNGVTSIGYWAFNGCISLTSVVISGSVLSIGDSAFSGCDKLADVTISDGVKKLGKCVFAGCDALTSLEIPASVEEMSGAIAACKNLTTISVAPENAYYCVQDGVVYSKDGKDLVVYPQIGETSVIVPDGVLSIEDYAFACHENLERVQLPAGIINIGNYAFHHCSKLTNVTIPDSITNIGSGAFEETALTSLQLPNGATNLFIRDDAFYGCDKLTSVVIPEGVTSIGARAFFGTSLKNATIPDSVADLGQSIFANCTNLESVTLSGNTPYLNGAFYGCISLKEVNYFGSKDEFDKIVWDEADRNALKNATVHYFEQWTVETQPTCTTPGYGTSQCTEDGCTKTYTGEISALGHAWDDGVVNKAATMTEYGDKTYTCTRCGAQKTQVLKALYSGTCGAEGDGSNVTWTLDNAGTLTISGTGAMYSYWNTGIVGFNTPWRNLMVKHVIIQDGVTSIGSYAFIYNHTIESVEISGTVQTIEGNAFQGTHLKSVTIPDNVTSIGREAFQDCTSLKNIALSNGVQHLGYVFGGCTALESVTIPSGVTSMGSTFEGCTSLKNITFLGGVTSIKGAFRNCTALTTVTLPDGIEDITNAFEGCTALTNVTLPDSVEDISSAFSGCTALADITLPRNLKTINGAFAGCASLTDIAVAEENPYFCTMSGIVYSKDQKTIAAYPAGRPDTAFAIPEGTTGIGNGAFYGCTNLTQVTIPEGVTSIGDRAFYTCTGLTEITIPEGVTSIGDRAFAGYYTFGDGTERTVNMNLTSVSLPNSLTSIGGGAFQYCTKLESVVIPDGVTDIERGTFSGCESLQSISIPDSVTAIGGSAFSGCKSLKSIAIPDGVTRIEGFAFVACESLESVVIPGTVTEIGNVAFNNGDHIKDVYFLGTKDAWQKVSIESENEAITENATIHYFSEWTREKEPTCTETGSETSTCSEADCGKTFTHEIPALGHSWDEGKVTKPATETEDGVKTFTCTRCGEKRTETLKIVASGTCGAEGDGSNLTWTLDSEGTLTISGTGAMKDFTSDESFMIFPETPWNQHIKDIHKIVVSDGVTTIGNCAFLACSAESILLPDSVERIGDKAFGFTSISEIIIPEGVKSIGEYVFSNCNLVNVTLPNSLESIGEFAFFCCNSLQQLLIPANVSYIGTLAFEACGSLKEILVDERNAAYSSLDGVLFNADKTEVIFCPSTRAGTYVIPDSVMSIGAYAFAHCGELTDITFPDRLARIGDHAFSGCASLTRLTIPSGVTQIGKSAFEACGSLTGIWVTDGNSNYSSDKHGVLFNYDKTELVRCPAAISGTYEIPNGVTTLDSFAFEGCKLLTGVSIPDGVVRIGESAFAYCKGLTSITIGNQVAEIGPSAFISCDNLKDVYYCGSESDWNKISIAEANDQLTAATIHYDFSLHSYGPWSMVKKPTCTEPGEETRSCTDAGCRATQTREIAALGHTDMIDVAKAATCTETGLTEGKHCATCGEVLVAQEVTPKLGHTEVVDAAKAATCTETGLTEGKHCSTCGEVLVAQEVTPKLGHAWDNGKVTKEPTETETGVKTFACTRCGETKTEVIPATGVVDVTEMFTDVTHSWADDGIQYCVTHQLMSGVGGNLFAPKMTTTRAQIVQILYNLEGEPKVSGTMPFTDLTQNWYKDAVLWAYQTGVVVGTSATTFEPDRPVTREQIAVILMEYVTKVLKLERTWTPADLSVFPDAGSVSGWAKDALADAVALGLISGASNGGQTYLEPQGSATREQVATILMEFCKNVKK